MGVEDTSSDSPNRNWTEVAVVLVVVTILSGTMKSGQGKD